MHYATLLAIVREGLWDGGGEEREGGGWGGWGGWRGWGDGGRGS